MTPPLCFHEEGSVPPTCIHNGSLNHDDYVLLSSTISVAAASAYVDTHIDLYNRVDDHRPVACTITPSIGRSAVPTKRRIPAYDRRAAQAPTAEQIQQVETMLLDPPLVDSQVDATSHTHVFDR